MVAIRTEAAKDLILYALLMLKWGINSEPCVFIRYKIFVKNILACTFQTKLGMHLLYGIGPRVIVYCAQKLNRCQLMNARYVHCENTTDKKRQNKPALVFAK